MKIGLIGLGNMGGQIAKRLMELGNELTVFDVNPDVVKQLESIGAKVANTPAQLAASNPYVITVLPNAHIVKSVTLGENGLLSGFKSGSTLIDMTSSVPEVTKEIGEELAQHGIRMLDAPVSGGVKKAELGTLAIMVGGEESVFNEVLPILQQIGTNITHVGGIGAGHTIKALNNLISASTMAITAEAMAVGVKLGLDPNKMLQVINTSSGRNNSSEVKFPEQVLSRKFEVGFTIDLMCKDLTIAMELAKNARAPMFASSSVFQLWQYAWSKGGGDMDHTAIVKFIEQMSDTVIQG
jgi:3-hydroxyisobutyrate dehydrogenase